MPDQIHILIVDDDEDVRQSLAVILEDEGYVVTGVGEGRQALAYLEKNPCQVAMVDIKLPDVSGLDLLVTLKDRYPTMAVVIISAYVKLENPVKSLNRGADAYIVKPFYPDETKAVIRKAVEKRGLLVENLRLLEETQRRNRELSALYTINRAVAQSLDLEHILNTVVEQMVRLFEVDHSGILIFDQARVHGRVVAEYPSTGVLGEQFPVQGYPAAERIIAHPQPLLVEDTQHDPLMSPVQDTMRQLDIRSMLILPLVVKDEVLGSIGLDAVGRPRRFDSEDIELAQTIANQVAIAIENAQLHQQTRQNLARITNLYELSSKILTTTTIKETAEVIVQKLAQAAGAHSALINLMDTEGRVNLRFGAGAQGALLAAEPLPRPAGATMTIFRTGEPLVVTGLEEESDDLFTPQAVKVGIKAFIGMPLKVSGRVTGVLFLRYAEPHLFSPDETQALTTYVNQAAMALEKARLYEETRRAADDLSLLYEAGQLFSSTLEQEQAFQEISQRCVQVLDVDLFLLRLIEDDRLVVKGSFNRSLEDKKEVERLLAESPICLGEGIAGRVAQTGEPAMSNGTPVETLTPSGYVQFLSQRKWLVVPMKVKDRIVGVLTFITGDPARTFSQRDLSLAQGIANQAAVAIENARLYEETKRRAEEMTSLLAVSVTTSSTLELDQVLRSIHEQIERMVDFDAFYIALYDEERGELSFEIAIDEGKPLSRFSRGLDEAGGLTAWIVRSGQPLLIRDMEQEWDGLPVEPQQVGALVRSWLGIPMMVKDKVVGVVSVQSYRPYAFSQDQQRLLSAMAAQAAVAITNARLHEEARRRAEEMTTLYNASLEISAHADLTSLLWDLCDQAAGLLGVPKGGLYLYDETREDLELVVPYNLKQDLVGTRLKPGEGVAGCILQTGQSLIVDDYSHWDGHALAYEGEPFTTVIGAPLKWQERVIGVVTLSGERTQRVFTPQDERLLSLFAQQAATAIENARLFDEARHRAAQQEALNAIIAAAAAAFDLPELLESALNHALQALGLEMGAIWMRGERLLRGLSPEIESFTAQMSQIVGLDIPGPVVVADWRRETGIEALTAIGPDMVRFGVRASLTVPILAGRRRIGGLSLAASEPRSWAPEEVSLAEAVGRQLGEAAERLRLLEKTRQQAQQVEQIVRSVPEGIFLLDAEMGIVTANPVACDYLAVLAGAKMGDTLTRLGGRPLVELLTSPPRGLWHEVELDGPPRRIFEVIARPTAERPRGMEAGSKAGGWVLVVRDVTREREVQQRVQLQERLAAVGQLAAGIAHDLSNVMAVIILYAQLASKIPSLPAKADERLTTIVQQAKQATGLIQQILDFSRRSALERKPMDLAPFLKELVKLLERTLPEIIRLELSPGGYSGEYMVDADPTRMQQVFMNLAVNARDAMPEGGRLKIELERIWLRPGEPPPLPDMGAGEWVRVTVSDSGMGIPADDLQHIFEPFFTTKMPGRGTGLGLAQVYGIVTQHEGFIDVASQVGRGTTFIVYLPALPFLRRPEALLQERPPVIRGRGETILVVEDNPTTREALVDTLDLLNYRVLEAADGQEALTILEQHGDEIALILSDLVMPDMGGMALLRALRQRELAAKVVILSGHPLDERAEELASEGAVGWFQKPMNLEQLARVVAETLEEDRGGGIK